VHFAKDQRKDDVTQSCLAGHDGSEAVLYVGRAQERATVMRTERRYDQHTGASYAWLVKASALVNHFYFYCFDDDFGTFFLKFCSYFPYNAKLCINGQYAETAAMPRCAPKWLRRRGLSERDAAERTVRDQVRAPRRSRGGARRSDPRAARSAESRGTGERRGGQSDARPAAGSGRSHQMSSRTTGSGGSVHPFQRCVSAVSAPDGRVSTRVRWLCMLAVVLAGIPIARRISGHGNGLGVSEMDDEMIDSRDLESVEKW
jgi:hypothetical protein